MSLDAAAVRAAVAQVVDPETGRTLGDLGLVGVPSRTLRRVRVPVSLLTDDHPEQAALAAAVRTAAAAGGCDLPVDVRFARLDRQDRLALGERLRGALPVTATPRVYAVASGKGGVGKSTVTANLAVALAASGLRVGVLDADVWGSSVPQLFGLDRHPVALGAVMLPLHAYGVRLMSTGFLVSGDEPVVWRGPMLHKALEQFLHDVAWGPLDVLLLDLPPGTGDITVSLLELVPDAMLLAVTTPQAAARTVAARVGRLARDQGLPVAGVVENMSAAVCATCGAGTPVFGSGGGAELAAAVEAPLLGQVPLDVALRESGDRGVPVVAGTPDAPSAAELARIAAALPTERRSLVRRPLPLTVV